MAGMTKEFIALQNAVGSVLMATRNSYYGAEAAMNWLRGEGIDSPKMLRDNANTIITEPGTRFTKSEMESVLAALGFPPERPAQAYGAPQQRGDHGPGDRQPGSTRPFPAAPHASGGAVRQPRVHPGPPVRGPNEAVNRDRGPVRTVGPASQRSASVRANVPEPNTVQAMVDVSGVEDLIIGDKYGTLCFLESECGVKAGFVRLGETSIVVRADSEDALDAFRFRIQCIRNDPEGFKEELKMRAAKYIHVFVDADNTVFGARNVGEGDLQNRVATELKVGKLVRVITNLRTPVKCVVSGTSDNSEVSFWTQWKQEGYTVLHADKSECRVRGQVPKSMQALMYKDIANHYATPHTLVLVTGTGSSSDPEASFPEVVNKALVNGWHVEVWGWRTATARVYSEFLQHYPGQFSLHELDKHRDRIMCAPPAAAQQAAPSSVRPRPQAYKPAFQQPHAAGPVLGAKGPLRPGPGPRSLPARIPGPKVTVPKPEAPEKVLDGELIDVVGECLVREDRFGDIEAALTYLCNGMVNTPEDLQKSCTYMTQEQDPNSPFTRENLRTMLQLLGKGTEGIMEDIPIAAPSDMFPPRIVTCAVCMDTFEVGQTWSPWDPELPEETQCDHHICFECLPHMINSHVEDKTRHTRLTCPGEGCNLIIKSSMVRQMLAEHDHKDLADQLIEHELQTVVATDRIFSVCPNPDCGVAAVTLPGEEPINTTCRTCNYAYCTACRLPAHYRKSCAQARDLARVWNAWQAENGRDEAMRAVREQDASFHQSAAEYEAEVARVAARNEELQRHRANFLANEMFLASSGQLVCPTPGCMVFTRNQGCNHMTCPLGHHFDYTTAAPYQPNINVTFEEERLMREAPQRSADQVHENVQCDNCNITPIVGLRLRCTNCPAFNLCQACDYDPRTEHYPNHVFELMPEPERA